jgi:hypothetical protein
MASNSLLVFVNVLGKWVGVIVDAPEGATAAAIGNNIKEDEAKADLTIVRENNALITNNLDLTSKSGNATVANNTQAGNATTGNASSSANIANIANNTIGLSGWFGVLFINVFGNWFGSFGIDTPYGNIPTSAEGKPEHKVIRFIPHEPKPKDQGNGVTIIGMTDGNGFKAENVKLESDLGHVSNELDKIHKSNNVSDETSRQSKSSKESGPNGFLMMSGLASVSGISTFAGIRRYKRSR